MIVYLLQCSHGVTIGGLLDDSAHIEVLIELSLHIAMVGWLLAPMLISVRLDLLMFQLHLLLLIEG